MVVVVVVLVSSGNGGDESVYKFVKYSLLPKRDLPARHEEGFAHRVGREGDGGCSEQNAERWKIKRYTQVMPVQYDDDENDDLNSSVETKISQEFSNLGEGSHFVEYKRAHYKK